MKKISIGGQALIEGIMMKSPQKTAVAVRTPSGEIDIEYINEKHIKDKIPFLGWPVLRGVVAFIESMMLGYKALMMSAEKSGLADLEEQEEKEKRAAKLEKKRQKALKKGKEFIEPNESAASKLLVTLVMAVGMVLGIGLAVVLFMWLPTFVFNGIKSLSNGAVTDVFRPLIEGVLKISIFVGYIALVSLTKDIKRVFMYHGAEHKTIFCLEQGKELTVENVKTQSRFHPRCGTSFMILMLIVGILISLLIVTLFPSVTNYTALWVAIKILMVPFICGLGYELIKICGKYNNFITRIIAAPGMWVQRLTTKEPEDDMIEVAIASIIAVLPDEEVKIDCCGEEN